MFRDRRFGYHGVMSVRTYPDLVLVHYERRFGHEVAVFYDIGMQCIDGMIDDTTILAHARHKSGTIIFLSKKGLEEKIEVHRRMDWNFANLSKALERWPKNVQRGRLNA